MIVILSRAGLGPKWNEMNLQGILSPSVDPKKSEKDIVIDPT
jgi:hypothetical protein